MKKEKIVDFGKWYAEFDDKANCVNAVYDLSYRKILGFSDSEYTDKQETWIINIHPEDRKRVEGHLEECLIADLNGKDFDIEYRMMTKWGYHWFHDYGHFMRREDGSVVRCDGVVFDIQETIDKEEIHRAISENNERIFALEDNFESLYDVEIESGRYVSYVKGDFYQKNVRDKLVNPSNYFDDLRENIDAIIYPEDRDGLYNILKRDAIREELNKSDHVDHYYRIITKDGPVWLKLRIVYKDASKENVIIGVFNAEEEMEAKEKDVRKVLLDYFVSAYDSAFFVDLKKDEFETIHMNYEFKKEFGQNGNGRDGMIKFVNEHIHPDDRAMVMQTIDKEYVRNRLTKEVSFSFTMRVLIDYAEKTMRGIIIRGADEDHVAVGFMDVTEEIKQQQEREQMLQEAKQKAEEASKAKSAFLFNMSHDIRTPMNAITGFTDKAIRHIKDPEILAESLDKVKSSGEYLLRIINDILDMAKIESGKLELKEEIHFTERKNNSIIEVMGAEAARKGIELHTEYKTKDKYLWVDENRVSQILANLLSNAVKYTKTGGEIWYSVEQIPCDKAGYGRYISTVKDTGCGMSPEFVARIFEVFERDESAVKSGVQGTGLGMSIVKKLVDAMNGIIGIESEPGIGTTVRIILDHRIATPEEIEKYKEKEDRQIQNVCNNFEGQRILLVEDNELNREIAVDLLEDAGFIVETAENGKSAVDMVKNVAEREDFEYYAAILMDIQMPVMNGYEATKQIRKMFPNIWVPIIALSANAFSEDREASISAGMDDHVAKPIRIEELFDALSRCFK